MRTSELAGEAGVNTETLRYYESCGLLPTPPVVGRIPRLSGRRGESAAVHQASPGAGFTHDEIKELVHLDAGGPDSCDAARALAEYRKADLERRISDLQRMHDDSLADLLATCDLPRGDRSSALLDAISNSPAEAIR